MNHSRTTVNQQIDIENRAYELHILNKAINDCLTQSVPATAEGLRQLLNQTDELVWQIATEIYTQSGYKVEFSTIRDAIRSRTKLLTARLAKERVGADRQCAELEKRTAAGKSQAEKRRQHLLNSTSATREALLEASGRDKRLSSLLLIIQDILSTELNVDTAEITLNSSINWDLGADELDILQVVVSIEEEFDVEISDDDSALGTVGDLLDCVYRKLVENQK